MSVGRARSRRSGRDPVRVRDITGTSYGMWRCANCGEMGRLAQLLPAVCPDCGAPREELYYWAED
jgi:rubrerythrin